MYPRLALYVLILSVTITSNAAPASELHEEAHWLSKRYSPSDIHDCFPINRDTVKAAMREVVEMIEIAHYRLWSLYNYFVHAHDIVYEPADPIIRVTYRTWQTFVEPSLPHMNAPYPTNKARALNNMEDILSLTSGMLKSLKPRHPVNQNADVPWSLQIFCGTEWLLSYLPENAVIDPKTDFFDNRLPPLVALDQVQNRTWVKLPYGKYEPGILDFQPIDLWSKPSLLGFTDLAGPFSSVVAINPVSFYFWNAQDMTSNGKPFQSRIKELPELEPHWKRLHISDLSVLLSSELVNMLSTLPDVTGRGLERDYDVLCHGETHGQQHNDAAYQDYSGWGRYVCATHLPLVNVDTAVKSSTNFMFLVVALYQTNRDYSRGLEQMAPK